MNLETVIQGVMEMTGEDRLSIVNEMIKDRTKEIRQIKTELKQLGMLRRYVDNETLMNTFKNVY